MPSLFQRIMEKLLPRGGGDMRSYRKLFDEGRAAHSQGEYHTALGCFELALERVVHQSKTATILGWIGTTHYELGNYHQARQAFESAMEITGQEASTLQWWATAVRRQGIVAFEAAEYRQAAELFTLTLKRADLEDERRNATMLWLGIALLALGEYRNSLESFELIVRSEPNNKSANEYLGYLLATAPDHALRDGSRALQIANLLIAGEDTNWAHQTLKAAALAELGRFEEAIPIYAKAMGEMPEDCRELRHDKLRRLKNREPLRCSIEYDRKSLQLWQKRTAEAKS